MPNVKWARQRFCFSSPRLPPSFLFNSPHSNKCPLLSRKTLEALENSITRLHKRFKIMVLSLCGEREHTWPWLKLQQTLRHLGANQQYCINAHWSSCYGYNCSCFCKSPQSKAKGQTLIERGCRHYVQSCVSVASQLDPESFPACLIKQ